jgi:hypothetical protein
VPCWRLLGKQAQALDIQRRLERENEALGQPDPYVLEELELLYRALGDEEQASRYAALRSAAG